MRATSEDFRPRNRTHPSDGTDETVASELDSPPMAPPETTSGSGHGAGGERRRCRAHNVRGGDAAHRAAGAADADDRDRSAPSRSDRRSSATLRSPAIRLAAFEVAARYAEGRGVLPDMPTAVVWYKRAAEAGLAPAQYRLGSIYEKGLGVPKDLAEAQSWYRPRRRCRQRQGDAQSRGPLCRGRRRRRPISSRRPSSSARRPSTACATASSTWRSCMPAGSACRRTWSRRTSGSAIAASSGDAESAKRRDIIGAALVSDVDKAQAEEAVATFQPAAARRRGERGADPGGRLGGHDNSTSVARAVDQNELVALVQKLLAENGFDPGPADGLLGNQTIEAITAFQEQGGPAEDRADRHRAGGGAAGAVDLKPVAGSAGKSAPALNLTAPPRRRLFVAGPP